ncbi:calmodulin-related [Lithospermum erythrorhizon]|uniref:Calmodulin-related n=1 Tax=Lithospermum erythrorhizon TaxID=34254 RepID=A0AAV3PGN6_LITER
MGKSSVIIYILTAIMILLFLSQHKPNNPHHRRRHHRHRRLKIRSNFTFTQPNEPPHKTTMHESLNDHHIPFDPLVAQIERQREDKQWEQHYIQTHHPESAQNHTGDADVAKPEWEGFDDAEEFLNDERKFNVSERLVVLFPKIDLDPRDGFVSESELTQWNLAQSLTEVVHRTEREMAIHDKNKDGFVSYAEYEPRRAKSSDNNTSEYESGWWHEDHFNASDADGDGLLNFTEFKDFLHTGDTTNPKLLLWLCQEEIRETDTNKDGKVDFKEFFNGVYDLLRNYDEEDHHTSHQNDHVGELPAKKLFDQLDKDGDGYLSDVDLLIIIGKLHPSEHFFAKQQAYYSMQQADTDKDGRLTFKEMVENPYAFYTSIYNVDDDEDYDDEGYEYHDEFR